jgi:uncharacterized protein (TIGR02466 family)
MSKKNKETTNKFKETFQPTGRLELFPTLTYHGKFDADLTKELVEHVEDIRKTDLALRSHVPQYDSRVYVTTDELYKDRRFKELTECLGEAMTMVAQDQCLSFKNVYCVGMWANISNNTYTHPEHNHPNSWMSGILYLKSPKGSAPTLLSDPRTVRQVVQYDTTEDTRENGFQFVNPPTEGEIVLFPSWVKHSVPPSIEMADGEERITLAFNYQLRADMERMTQKWTV